MDPYDEDLEDDTLEDDLEDGVISEDELAELDLLDDDPDELGGTYGGTLADDDPDDEDL